MMSRTNKILAQLRFAMAIFAVVGVGSCQFRPLEDPDNSLSISVRVNTKAISNITCDIYNDKVPVPEINTEMMHVLFFDSETDKVAAESYITKAETTYDEEGIAQRVLSGGISVRPGKYKMLIYNFDTESTLIRGMDRYSTIEAYADNVPISISTQFPDVMTKWTKSDDNVDGNVNIVFQPDQLVVARNPEEVIPFHTGHYLITTEARSVVDSYYLQIMVDGLQYVSSAQAVLSGMAYSNYLGQTDGKTSAATLYFTLEKSQSARDGNADVLCCVFNTFGHLENAGNSRLYVTFNIKTTNGIEKTHTFEISNLFKTEDCIKHHWLLLNEKITVDPPPQGAVGGGFDPVVEDWDHEDHTVIF